MTFPDPFDEAQVVEEPQVPAEIKPVVIKSPAVGSGEGKIVSTYKEGAGYDASWTVVHAANVDDWFEIHDNPRFKELLDKQKKVAAYFRAGNAPAAAAAAAPQGGGAPAGAQQAPGGEKRFCEHGEMVFKSGVSKTTGKPYKLFSCTAPRDQQCKAQFLNG